MKRAFITLMLALAPAFAAHAADKCFGAVGQQCGLLQAEGLIFAACVPAPWVGANFGVCSVSGGSMTHDPCCAANPHGKVCGTSPENPNVCAGQWDRAVNRFVWGYQWSRTVDTSKTNSSGVVVKADYCAKNGRGVHKNDESFCCSGDAKNASFWERIGRPNLKICH